MAKTEKNEDGEIESVLGGREANHPTVVAPEAHGDGVEGGFSGSRFANGLRDFAEPVCKREPAAHDAGDQKHDEPKGRQYKPRITSGVEPMEQRCHDELNLTPTHPMLRRNSPATVQAADATLLAALSNTRSASLTDSASGKGAATSEASVTITTSFGKRPTYLPRTPPVRSYSS